MDITHMRGARWMVPLTIFSVVRYYCDIIFCSILRYEWLDPSIKKVCSTTIHIILCSYSMSMYVTCIYLLYAYIHMLAHIPTLMRLAPTVTTD